MFDSGFGIGLTVVPVHPDDDPAHAVTGNGSEHGDLRPARLAEMLPVAGRSDADIAAELGRVSSAEAQLAAYNAELVAGLSRLRPNSLDRPSGTDGSASDRWVSGRACMPGVSEFFSDELAMVINSGRMFAGDLALDCVTVVEQLPMTYAALADGVLDWSRARVISEMLGDRPRHVIEAVEAELVPVAASLSQRRLRDRICRTLIRINALAARERLERAKRAADVIAYPTEGGMGVLSAELPYPLAAACRDAVDTYAQMVKKDGDERPIGQIRAGVLSDLILRPWDTSRPPVTAAITLLVPLPALDPDGNVVGEPDVAEVDGAPITAEQCQALLDQLGVARPGSGMQAPAGGSLDIMINDEATGAQRVVTTLAGVGRAARNGGLTSPTGTGRYTPTESQDRFVRRRDRTCRFPSCSRAAVVCDVDHAIPWPNGDTDCRNLCCLCRRHHRLKTHSPGWRFKLLDDATLIVTTPSAITRTTRPPGLRTSAQPHPPVPLLAPASTPPESTSPEPPPF